MIPSSRLDPWLERLPGGGEQVRTLLRAQLAMILNGLLRRGRARYLCAVSALALAPVAWFLAAALLRVPLSGALATSPARLTATLTGGITLLCGFTLVTSVSFAVASAYFSRDLEWLLSLPLTSRSILAHRLASQLCLGALVGTALLGPPLLAAYADRGQLALLPLGALALLALLAVPVGLGLVLVVAAVRLVPASRVRDATAATVTLTGFGLAALDISGRAPGQGTGWAGAVRALGSGALGGPWFPPGWVARELVAGWRGQDQLAVAWALPLLLLAMASLGFCLAWAAPRYRPGWAKAQLAPRRQRRPVRGRYRLPPVLAVLVKDWRSLRRDPIQLSQLVLPLALFAVYLLVPAAGAGSLSLFRDFPLWYGPLTTSAFAAMFVASGLGLRAVGTEGRQLWCLRSSPLSLAQLLLGKLALPLLVAVGASLALLWSAELRAGLGPADLAFSSLLLVLCVGGLAALATGLGAIWPRLDWGDPRRAIGIWLSVGFLLLGSAYVAVCMVALTLPLVLPALGPLGSALGAVLACGLCALLAGGATLRLAHARLLRLEL